ncbi:MAG TPA: hypothetical protein VN616_10290 [Puia sp.]|nr:hypothetical protein [Puia sp.]
MKPFILLTLAVILNSSVTAQSGGSGQQIIQKKCGVDHINLPLDKYGQGYPKLFRHIRVVDARPDTLRMGIVRIGGTRQHELQFREAPAAQPGDYLDAAYAKASGRLSLLIVLKDVWISTPDSFQSRWNNEWNIRFRVEAYLSGRDGFQPLTRMDSTVEKLHGPDTRIVAQQQLRELFDVFMGQVAASDFARQRPSVSYTQIDSFNRTRFAYPMDTATVFPKGVYATVDDFWNNSPSILKYSVDTDAGGNLELNLPDETGKLIFNHTVWGYCDGSRPYVMMDGNFFPIFNSCHQFYVMGSKEYRRRTYSAGYTMGMITPFAAIPGAFVTVSATASVDMEGKTMRTLRIFRIEPETGRVIE